MIIYCYCKVLQFLCEGANKPIGVKPKNGQNDMLAGTHFEQLHLYTVQDWVHGLILNTIKINYFLIKGREIKVTLYNKMNNYFSQNQSFRPLLGFLNSLDEG